MPSKYSGAPANVLTPGVALINGATNASPIVVSTTLPHQFSTGDRVVVQQVGGNTAANSPQNWPWIIDVTDSTHFSLRGSTGNGVYTSGGFAEDISPNPPIYLPNDGEPRNAASLNVGLQGLADLGSFLYAALPMYRVVAVYTGGASDDTWATWASQAISSTSWAVLLSGASPVGDLFSFASPVPRINQGDALLTTWDLGEVVRGTTSGDFALTLAYQFSSLLANAFTQAVGGAKHFPQFPAGGVGYTASVSAPVTGTDFVSLFGGGAAATIASTGVGVATITGLTGMSTSSPGDTLVLSGAANPSNNGEFPIVTYISATSVVIANPLAVAPDANSGAITWYPNNMKFSLQLQASATLGTSSSYTLKGHRSMKTIHLRPPVWPWPRTVM